MTINLHDLAARLGSIKSLDRVAGPLAKAVKKATPQGLAKDALSGTWLGHPLHPLLTDIPIGSFTSASILDLVGGHAGERAADALIAVGLASAVPTAAAGLADWSDADGDIQRIGVVHAVANAAGLVLYGASLLARRQGRRGRGRVLALAGMGVMTVGGYLGGHMSYGRGVGVNNAFWQHGPDDWTSVLDDEALAEGASVKVEAGDATVLLHRRDGHVLAIGNRCSHAGGPLDEGATDAAGCVTCPWHQSVFRIEDGAVVHGPATIPLDAYDTRVEVDHIEIRRHPLR